MTTHPLVDEVEEALGQYWPDLPVRNYGSYLKTSGVSHWAVAEQIGAVRSAVASGPIVEGRRLSVEFVTTDNTVFAALSSRRGVIDYFLEDSVAWLPGGNDGSADRSILRISRSLTNVGDTRQAVRWAVVWLRRLHDASAAYV